ncbi:methionine adenosyltransferase [Candidatus Micrarchaeota archaeon CG10_big_fil_rev_8_21_14_0_10_54_18]|nr:MAG: methionine adenosyltransferase [Candidatus Micrarchaeota archaeon CG1_02_55_41]PJD01136.1 MAG: methionine adenosyltransferase [Candidatus Micrarchaeota archaeon CG10_big_fil_rev_8_21_14_0_10_54_18]
MSKKELFTSESVTEGHPDKICDKVSDAILDAMLEQDADSRVAVECLTTTGLVMVAGEVTTKGYVNIPGVVRNTLKEIGYTNPEYGIDYKDCAVLTSVHEQSQNIAVGVNQTKEHEQGAGDQGMMFGFACNDTPELMPLPISLAHKLTRRLSEVRKQKILDWVRPDGKSQVTVEYEDGKPRRVTAVVIAVHHDPKVSLDKIHSDVIQHVIKPVCGKWVDRETKYHINATGVFAVGGPEADSGVTGRKIIVDTYGGMGRHGGGCFSGKDPSKVDRSAAYMARYVAKNVVAAGLADKCEVQLAYSIGVADPVSVRVDCFGTNKVEEEKIVEAVRKEFAFKPAQIIKHLKLKRPIYAKTAAYGHFGREEPGFTWEKTDKAAALKKACGL